MAGGLELDDLKVLSNPNYSMILTQALSKEITGFKHFKLYVVLSGAQRGHVSPRGDLVPWCWGALGCPRTHESGTEMIYGYKPIFWVICVIICVAVLEIKRFKSI